MTAPKILILEGAVGSPPGQDRPKGFKNRLATLMPKAQIVNSVSADWDRLRAMNIAADTLTRTPDLNVIFAANDVMALGAVEAVRGTGKQGQVMIVGVDGIPDARKAISEGHIGFHHAIALFHRQTDGRTGSRCRAGQKI